jgi:mannose-6-phosphate isomerase
MPLRSHRAEVQAFGFVCNQENSMAMERAGVRIVRKPWGCSDLRPWSEIQNDGDAIGELWFQRDIITNPAPALLLKLLFTTEPLSIQVHPDDAYARSIGLPNGKTEAWYILSATPDAKIAVGLNRTLTADQLRAAIADQSIADMVQWRSVVKDDVISIPAGTIHAIGAGLVVAEIQQRSDATFRMYDHGRQRELHVADAVASANAYPAPVQIAPVRLTDARTLLAAHTPFVLERIDLPPGSDWELNAERETWFFTLAGHARIGSFNLFKGDAVFLDADHAAIKVGVDGLQGLLAYAGPDPEKNLLRCTDDDVFAPPMEPVPHLSLDAQATTSPPMRAPGGRTWRP